MKARIGMMLSVAGVLVAGSAAAMVNTHVLSGNADASPFSAQVDDVPETSAPVVTASPVESSTATTVSTPTSAPVAVDTAAQPSVVSTTHGVYSVGDSTVELDTSGDVLTVIKVTPGPGWTVTKSETQDPTNIEVKLQSGTSEIEFHANLLFGVVNTSIESHDASVTANSIEDNHGGGHGGGGSDDSGGDD